MDGGTIQSAQADSLGFSIKLLGIASKTADGAVLQRVHPAMIPARARSASPRAPVAATHALPQRPLKQF